MRNVKQIMILMLLLASGVSICARNMDIYNNCGQDIRCYIEGKDGAKITRKGKQAGLLSRKGFFEIDPGEKIRVLIPDNESGLVFTLNAISGDQGWFEVYRLPNVRENRGWTISGHAEFRASLANDSITLTAK